VAWLSLDKNDNDITRFLTYLIAALQHIDEDIGVDLQAALGESQSPQYEILLTRLVNEIEGIPDKSILVFDDYHLIDSKAVHDALNFLIEYLPSSMHIVISGRADPPLPISRLRVRGEVSEIRTPDLRFTITEMAAFLNDLMGFDLSSDDIAALEARTEGWIASLQLAALSMQGRDDWREFIAAFSGSHRYIIDYLVDEVMARQREEVQVFLRRTSILEHFSAPLCHAVISGEEKRDEGIINYLDRSNLFLIPLDDHREWYRYHHLFADFLRQRLNENESELIPDLHRRASKWYEAEGLVDEAIRHALAAGDMESATRLVDGIAADLVVRRESNKLLKLVGQLPNDLSQDYPMLCIWQAWAFLFSGQLEAVEPVLEIAEANRDKVSGIPILGYTTTVRAYLVNQMGDLHKAIDLSKQALVEMSVVSPDRNTLIHRGAAIIWLGVNHRFLGDLGKARDFFAEAVLLNQEAGNIYGALSAIAQLADLAVICGHLHQAVETYQRGLQIAQRWKDEREKGRSPLVAESELHLGLGTVQYIMNDLTIAEPHIQQAIQLHELGETSGSMHSKKMLAYLKQAEGDYETAYDLVDKACMIRDSINIHHYNLSVEPGLEQLRRLPSRI
jgi:LuxR family maltose regulon positive regulatory protein